MVFGHINQKGFMLLAILGAVTIFLAFASGLASLGIYQNQLYVHQYAKVQALHVAEAGINYYVWHLAHNQNDFYDGTGSDPGPAGSPYGPYTHTYSSPAGDIVGSFSIEITPPPSGSTIVNIKSTGWINKYPNLKREISVRYGIQSLAHFSFLTNTDAWFDTFETVHGELHSNGGVRMDGINDAKVTSSRLNYTCISSHGCDSTHCANPCTWYGAPTSTCECPGVWGVGSGSALWNYPVTNIDFNNITTDLAKLKALATSTSGKYFDSQGSGYHIIFKSNGTFDIYKVNNLENAISQKNDNWSGMTNIAEQIKNENNLQNFPIPANGIIYVEDNIWVEGTVKGRVTLVAAKLPDNVNTRKTIHINNNINYLARDGTNILGLVAQKHIKVPRHAPTNLNIDAILLAQNGRVFRNYYASPSIKNSIQVYGGIITNNTWTWTWTNSGVVIDGYSNTASTYDNQVLFSPPPSFPTTGEYSFISWDEK
jgi:hypothetical protein